MIPNTETFPASLTIFIMFYPSQLKLPFNTILIMFFIGFPILSYRIQLHATTSIGYTKPYGKPSQSNLLSNLLQITIAFEPSTLPIKNWVFKSRSSFKVRQHDQQQLYFQYKLCWTLYKIMGAPSFSKPCLYIQQPLQSPPTMLSSTSVNFHLTFPLLFNKIILTIYFKTPFLYTAAFFYIPIFVRNHPNSLHQKCFPYLSHLPNSGCVKGQRSYGVLWGFLISPFFL